LSINENRRKNVERTKRAKSRSEAIGKKAGLIISHHPVIFGQINKISGHTVAERIIIKAIKNDIAIYSCHTNLDSTWNGLNIKLNHIFHMPL